MPEKTGEIKKSSEKEQGQRLSVAMTVERAPFGVLVMMIILSRIYPDSAKARTVVDELKAAGLPEGDIGIIATSGSLRRENAQSQNADDLVDTDHNGVHELGQTVNRGAGIGAALGGAAGLLAGLGAFILPGIGAVVAAGWLASALAGAVAGGAAGGVVGALIEAGVSENDAEGYAESVRRGGTLVTIRVTGHDRDFYEDILTGRDTRVREAIDLCEMAGKSRELDPPEVKHR